MMAATSRAAALICTLLLLTSLLCLPPAASGHGGIDDGDGDGDGTPAARADGASSLRSKGLVAVKVWCLVILLVFTFVAGVSPYLYRWNESFLLLGTQFAAGIFLGTALMHFLADSTTTFHGLTTNHYPFSYMLACAGFLLTMLADCAIVAVANRSRAKKQVNEAAAEAPASAGGAAAAAEEAAKVDSAAAQHPMLIKTSSFEDAVLLIVALCFHSVFEGIAIGVSGTKSDAWRNLWTIGLHKVFAAVAMGIALLRMLPRRALVTTVAYSAAFAASSPVGVGVGIAIDATAEGSAADWTFAVSMGFATGVFVYVAVNHLMAKGFRPHRPNALDTPLFKFLAVLLGVAVMAVAMIWD